MKSGKYIPDRGDFVWLDFDPQAGHEQRGNRPALIISPKIYNEKTSLCLALPITSKVKGYPFEVAIEDIPSLQGVILSDQIKSLDFRIRKASFIAKASPEIIAQVQKNIQALIG